MDKGSQADNIRQERDVQHFDLSEEGSKRPEGAEATKAARQSGSDDINEELDRGAVDGPDGDGYGENKVATSLDEE